MMRQTIIFSLLFLMFANFELQAQQQRFAGVAWKKVYGEKGDEQARDVVPTFDGNIAVLGTVNNSSTRKDDVGWWLLDPNGAQLQSKSFGLPGDDYLVAMTQTFDGGFMLAGHTNSAPGGKTQPWLVKLDEKGDTLWQRIVEQPGKAEFRDILQTTTGELVITGFTENKYGNSDIWVYCTYEDGTLRWQRTYGDDHSDEGVKIVETPDGNFAVGGVTSSGKGSRNLWLFILDRDGNPLNYKIFGSRQWEELQDLIPTSDGGFALAGTAKTNNQNKGKGLKDFWLIKTAYNGELQWQNTFGGANNDGANGLAESPDGGFIVVGYTFSHLIGANTSEGYVVKADKNGKLVWEDDDSFGGKSNDELAAIFTMTDGSMVIVGSTSSKEEGAKGTDIWGLRLHAETFINHRSPTNLVVREAVFQDNGDQTLEEGEKAYLKVTLENSGAQDAFDVELLLREKTGAPLKYREFQKIGVVRAGRSRTIFVPIEGRGGLKAGDAVMEVYCTDISRSRSASLEKTIACKPLVVPSNFLDVAWLDPNPVEFPGMSKVVKTNEFSVKVKARSDRELLRKFFTVYINGQPYRVGAKAGETSLASRGKAKEIFMYEYANRVKLSPGENLLEVEVDNGSRKIRSAPFKVVLSEKPNLHVLAVGIEHDDLNFTKKDAKDFAAGFAGQENGVFDKVYVTTLISGEQNKAGLIQTKGEVIKKAFAELRDNYNYTIYGQDLLVVFISSHGKTVRGDFKIVPTDFTLEGENALVDYRKDIVEPLDALPCTKLLFVDACHSGSAEEKPGAKSEPTKVDGSGADVLASVNADSKSTNMLASCGAAESSWEDATWGNGAFTKAILAAFRNETYADAEGEFLATMDDDVLTIGELYNYLIRRVPAMVKAAGKDGTQKPYMEEKQLLRVINRPIFQAKTVN